MSGNTDVESKSIERYGTVAKLSARLKTGARGSFRASSADDMLPDLSCALLDEGTPSFKRRLFEIGSVALLRSDKA